MCTIKKLKALHLEHAEEPTALGVQVLLGVHGLARAVAACAATTVHVHVVTVVVVVVVVRRVADHVCRVLDGVDLRSAVVRLHVDRWYNVGVERSIRGGRRVVDHRGGVLRGVVYGVSGRNVGVVLDRLGGVVHRLDAVIERLGGLARRLAETADHTDRIAERLACAADDE